MDPLLEQFLQEARENLAFIDQNIEQIGSHDAELLNSVFRAAHTLKGGSGIVGFDSVKHITHRAEDLLDMLRAGRIEFQDSMTETLFDAFDEVMNLIEAAEESGDIVEADADTLAKIVEELNGQMGKSTEDQAAWKVPFTVVEDLSSVVDLPLKTLRGVESCKIPFKNRELDEAFCATENLYAVVFDVDESCMQYGNDPVYALSLLNEKVLGIYSCMSDKNAVSVLSGIDNEDGLLLRLQIVAFIYAAYEEIEDALFNFIDEIQMLPLDISTLLSIDAGDKGHRLDLLKELAGAAKSNSISDIILEVEKSMELVGTDTLQYAQLQRFLDIAGLVKESDAVKLTDFLAALYKGEVYKEDETAQEVPAGEEEVFEMMGAEEECMQEADENIKTTLQNMIQQQLKALSVANSGEDLQRVMAIMESMRRFLPEMPKSFNSKEEMARFLKSHSDNSVSEEEKNSFEEEKIEIALAQDSAEAEAALPNEAVKEMVNRSASAVKSESKKAVVGKTVKIEQESIDSLMNVVGELLVAKNSLPYLADNVADMSHEIIKREIMEKYIFINRLSEQLQDLIMGMRMLPISYVFDRYPKLVRDISKDLGKKVRLEMDGGDTKLDKNMIEMLADPMIHIMRNSLDHGIETPEVREQKGKDATGTVSLKAFAQSDRIIIEIVDDGAGINIKKLASKVMEKGLMTYEQIDALSEKEMAELVLLPGLSTVDQISEYSGRGVGMDVVKKSIEGFGGTINIKTAANKGTTITLAIPASLAVTSLLHVQMNSIHYGIPMDSVSETVKLEKDQIEYLHNEPFIYLRGEVIPLLFIKSMLSEEALKNEPLSIVVLNIKDNLLAVVVNKLLGQLDVVQKPLVGIMEHHPIFSGTALLGNGQIIMAIDPLGLLGISQKLKAEMQVA